MRKDPRRYLKRSLMREKIGPMKGRKEYGLGAGHRDSPLGL